MTINCDEENIILRNTFKEVYASAYDLLYSDKDYEKECDLIERIFHEYSESQVKSVLDLGCGTGNHSFPLARRGYHVTGVDISEDMIRVARRKVDQGSLEDRSLPLNFIHNDLHRLDLSGQFDAVLMMFAVLGYQSTNLDVLAALKTVRRHLKSGALFIFDVWYGPAVLTIGPTDRVKHVTTTKGRVIRTVTSSLDVFHHLAEVQYHTIRIEGDRITQEATESHKMRYFFPQELALFLTQSDLKMLGLFDFNEFNKLPTTGDWNVVCFCEAL